MKISKREALVVSKLLHVAGVGVFASVAALSNETAVPPFQRDSEALRQRIDAFLEDADAEDDEDLDEEDEDEELQEEEEEEEEEEELADEETEDDEGAEPIDPMALHYLPSLKTSAGTVDLSDPGTGYSIEVQEEDGTSDEFDHVQRLAHEVLFRYGEDDWTTYSVKRFPKQWTQTLALSVTYRVEA